MLADAAVVAPVHTDKTLLRRKRVMCSQDIDHHRTAFAVDHRAIYKILYTARLPSSQATAARETEKEQCAAEVQPGRLTQNASLHRAHT